MTASDAGTGVAEVEIFVDHRQLDDHFQRCRRGGCSMRRHAVFRTARHPGGVHDVEVLAEDVTGNVTRRSLHVRTRCCIVARAAAGTLDPALELHVGRVRGATDDVVGYDRATGALEVGGVGWASVPAGSEVAVGDVSGDGLADVVARAGDTIFVAVADGSRFAPAVAWGSWPADAGLRLANVDGLAGEDLVGRERTSGAVRVALSTGAGFAAPTTWGRLERGDGYQVADTDGDGMADLIAVRRGAVLVGRARQVAFGPLRRWGALRGTPQAFDLQGDRLADLATVDRRGVLRVAASTGSRFLRPRAWGRLPTAVTDVAFGHLGGSHGADVLTRDRTGRLRLYRTWAAAPG